MVRRDNNPKRNLDEKGGVRAIGKLLAAGTQIADYFQGSDQLRNGPSTCYWRGHSARENREPALGLVI